MKDAYALLDAIQEGVMVIDRAGKVRFWNAVMASWTGASAADVVGSEIGRWAPKLGEERYRKRMIEALNQMSPITFSAAIHHYLIPCHCAVGASDPCRSQDTMMKPVELDGERLLVVSVVDRTDDFAHILDLKQVNAQLKRSARLRRESDRINTMLAAGMDNAAEAVLVVDHRGQVEYANQMFYQMAQLTHPSVRNKPLTELLQTEQGVALQQEVGDVIACGKMWRSRVIVRRPDGSRFPVSVSAAPARLRGGRSVSHAVLILEDITSYEVANHELQARKKHEAMLTMVAGISHDFNNLLSGMVGNAYLLRKFVRDEAKAARHLATIEEALREASEIIQNLMIYARGEEMLSGVLPLAPFIKEWCKEVQGLLPEAVSLQLHLQQDYFPVKVDVGLLQQALMSVAENALDAVMDVDQPQISIRFHYVDDTLPPPLAGRAVLLEVEDNGCGIPEGSMAQVCDPFFSTKKLGSGLGLSVARSSVEQHGGVLQIRSSQGEGTTVSIWLPLAE